MRKAIKRLIIKMSITLSFFGILLSITGCNDNEIHNYNELVSTSNISKIEYKMRSVEDIRYDLDQYTTLIDSEKECFVTSLNGEKYKYIKYDKNANFGNNTDTYIITYEDGSKTIFDNYHVKKIDKNGNTKFNKKITPYNCVIGQNIFVDMTIDYQRESFDALIYFEKYGYMYELKQPRNLYNYYRTIDGYLTNDSILVYYKDGRFKSVSKSEYTLKDQEIYPIKYEGYKYDTTDATILSVKQETTYIISDEYVTPIERTVLYREDARDSVEITKNLYTGEVNERPLPLR